jgi:hypothetical protein
MQYPILCFSTQTFGVFLDESSFLRSSKSGVKGRWFREMVIVDYNGFRFQVAKAIDKGRAYWSWSDLFFDPMVRVEIEVEPLVRKISIEEVMELIYAAKIRWECLEESFDFKAFKQGIKRAKNVQDLIEFLIAHNQVHIPDR